MMHFAYIPKLSLYIRNININANKILINNFKIINFELMTFEILTLIDESEINNFEKTTFNLIYNF